MIGGLEEESNKPRLEHFTEKVEELKRELRFYEELVTREICLQNGQHYKVKNNER